MFKIDPLVRRLDNTPHYKLSIFCNYLAISQFHIKNAVGWLFSGHLSAGPQWQPPWYIILLSSGWWVLFYLSILNTLAERRIKSVIFAFCYRNRYKLMTGGAIDFWVARF